MLQSPLVCFVYCALQDEIIRVYVHDWGLSLFQLYVPIMFIFCQQTEEHALVQFSQACYVNFVACFQQNILWVAISYLAFIGNNN